MSREKQIEEIRKDIFNAFGGYAKWEEDWQSLAEAVYNAGYRKQSEVEELITEFDKMVDLISAMTGLNVLAYGGKFAELRKKYTEGERD